MTVQIVKLKLGNQSVEDFLRLADNYILIERC